MRPYYLGLDLARFGGLTIPDNPVETPDLPQAVWPGRVYANEAMAGLGGRANPLRGRGARADALESPWFCLG